MVRSRVMEGFDSLYSSGKFQLKNIKPKQFYSYRKPELSTDILQFLIHHDCSKECRPWSCAEHCMIGLDLYFDKDIWYCFGSSAFKLEIETYNSLLEFLTLGLIDSVEGYISD